MVHKRSFIESFLIYGVLVIGSIVMFYPFLFQVLASLASNRDYYATLIVPIPTKWHVDRYVDIFLKPEVYRLYVNTFLRCAWYIFITCFMSLVAGYVFSKLRFKGRDSVFLIFLASMMIPGQVTLVPTYLLYARWPFAGGNDWLGQGGHGLIDSWAALLVGGLVPVYSIFLMKQMMDSLPFDYEEAARVDGAGVARTIFGIYLPMTKPILAALVIMTFIGIWNDYLWPLIAISSTEKQVIATGISSLMAATKQVGKVPDYPSIFALATITMIPPIVVYLWLQKYFVQAFAMTGVKG
ncbi:carbohydrate ABC transporter permease [Paenibacillus mendelii]|uniref:Carbohydrate ABC transporter permease n=1 Tax=Paenibacillus mendelii TaxID=206163 RepID=A0ABV6J9R8_9BACL|nr:carbohydrate ABC transporter permease [Paenibacillus mendelii]MCQ6561010.1 carbohydrate ABC transporter permease [Paenibacillus mendelii]